MIIPLCLYSSGAFWLILAFKTREQLIQSTKPEAMFFSPAEFSSMLAKKLSSWTDEPARLDGRDGSSEPPFSRSATRPTLIKPHQIKNSFSQTNKKIRLTRSSDADSDAVQSCTHWRGSELLLREANSDALIRQKKSNFAAKNKPKSSLCSRFRSAGQKQTWHR